MKKKTSKTSVVFRTLLVFPVVALLLYGFSEKRIVPMKFSTTHSSKTEHIVKKQFVLLVDNSEIFLNAEQVALRTFAQEVDNLTKDWEETDYTSIPVQANFSRTPLLFLKKVEKEFQKTHFSKSNEGMKIFPEGYENKIIQKGASREQMKEYNAMAKKYNTFPIEKRVIPLKDLTILEKIYRNMTQKQKENAQPFPECLPKNRQTSASREQMKEYDALAKKYNAMTRENMRVKIKEVERMKYIYGLMSDKQKADAEPFPDFPVPPEPPTFRSPPEVRDIAAPPAPPTPPSPLDHVIEMAKKGATFYYEGKEVSSDRAIELLKSDESLNIQTTKKDSKNPQVRISKRPFRN